MDLAMVCDSLSALKPLFGPCHLENAELSCNLPLWSSPLPPTLHPYISACSVDKNYLKWWEIQLAMHFREDSQTDLE